MANMPDCRSGSNGCDASDGGRPLAGLRALDLGFFTAGPLCARLLADLGVDVVKVEPPDGDPTRRIGGQIEEGTSYLFCANNAGKRSIVLDLKTNRDLHTLDRMIAVTDILIANFTLETMERMGLGRQRCRKLNPRLIYCMVTGYGADGPLRSERAMDMCVQARSGMMALTGSPEDGPTKVGISVSDDLAASCAVAGVIAAVIQRDLSGEGQFVDASLFDTSVWSTQYRWPAAFDGSPYAGGLGNADPAAGTDGVYSTEDGYIAVSIRDDKDAHLLRTVMADDACDQADSRNLIAHWASRRSTAQAEEILRRRNIPCAGVASVAQVASSSHVAEREMFRHPPGGGPMVMSAPYRFGQVRSGPAAGAPRLGRDHAQVLADWLGDGDHSESHAQAAAPPR